MKAVGTESRNFELFENTKKLGRLTYKNWLSYAADIVVEKMPAYEIKSQGFLGASFGLFKENSEVAIFKMNFKGQMALTFKNEQDYIFKKKGILNSKYILENTNGQELIRFMPSFDWQNLKYSYDIAYEDKPDILLVLSGIFCANYYIALSGGAVSSTV